MSWTPATPEKRIETLEHQVAELQRIVERLQSRATLTPAPAMMTLGDRARVPWHDATTPALTTSLGGYATYAQPKPAHSWDVGTAFKAGLASGCMAAILSAPLAIAGSAFGLIDIAWYFPGAVFCVAAPVTFFAVVLHPASKLTLVERVEQVVGVDINGDGKVGEQEIEWKTVHHEWADKNGVLRVFEDWPQQYEGQFDAFIVAALADPSMLTEEGARDHDYTRKPWLKIREKLFNHGWVKWNVRGVPTQGISFTDDGRAHFEESAI